MRRSVKELPEMRGEQEDVAFFELMNSHLPRNFARLMRRLPTDPRCRLCNAPFGGVGGRLMRRVGFGPSRKNPNLCNTCFEKAPMGGVEMETGVLFADVRGFTSLAEKMAPDDVAQVLNRFYGCATEILTRSAIVDKLVGDEVMALYFPMLLGERWEGKMVDDARDLLTAVGYGADGEPWLRLGVGLDVKDFTALGDVVNTAARLQSSAEAGQVVMSERLFVRLGEAPAGAAPATLELKGKSETEPARVLDYGSQ
ncbi:MAG: adenylate/guanylate cyclase domain-containing protein [Actinobacteria bacterium]|nr:MAG: adenylate/guanylate cyclase domain-containing protein [Actinomycetota bacterium]